MAIIATDEDALGRAAVVEFHALFESVAEHVAWGAVVVDAASEDEDAVRRVGRGCDCVFRAEYYGRVDGEDEYCGGYDDFKNSSDLLFHYY